MLPAVLVRSPRPAWYCQHVCLQDFSLYGDDAVVPPFHSGRLFQREAISRPCCAAWLRRKRDGQLMPTDGHPVGDLTADPANQSKYPWFVVAPNARQTEAGSRISHFPSAQNPQAAGRSGRAPGPVDHVPGIARSLGTDLCAPDAMGEWAFEPVTLGDKKRSSLHNPEGGRNSPRSTLINGLSSCRLNRSSPK